MPSIYGEPAVVKRIEYRTEVRKVTSNSTVAAATMVMAALLALVVANSPAHEIVEKFFEAECSFAVGAFTVSISFEVWQFPRVYICFATMAEPCMGGPLPLLPTLRLPLGL